MSAEVRKSMELDKQTKQDEYIIAFVKALYNSLDHYIKIREEKSWGASNKNILDKLNYIIKLHNIGYNRLKEYKHVILGSDHYIIQNLESNIRKLEYNKRTTNSLFSFQNNCHCFLHGKGIGF